MNGWLEWFLIAFIVLAIAWVVWRGGQANPESTGEVGDKVSKLSSEVGKLATRLGHVEGDVKELQSEAATAKDIARLEERIETVRTEAAGHRELSEATNRTVRVIERVLIEKGLGK